MTETLQLQNTRYLSYLLEIGVIDTDQHEYISHKGLDKDEKKLLGEISNFFANFTASDWFDLSCRIFKSWQKHSSHSKSGSASFRQNGGHPQSYENDGGRKNKNTQQQKIQGKDLKTSELSLKSWGSSSQTRPNFQQPNQISRLSTPTVEIMEIKERISRFVNVLENRTIESAFTSLKNYCFVQSQQPFVPYETKDYQELKMMASSRSTARSYDQEHVLKLYNDHFQKQANNEIRREMKKSSEMEACTFVPRVNRVDPNNQTLASALTIPVYERLSQPTRQIPPEVLLERQEYKELEGATFTPDISKSQRRWGHDSIGSPEDIKANAADRLFGDAHMKEKLLLLKQMNQKKVEADACTFSPQVLSPIKDKDGYSKLQMSKSVDRLYDENMKRQRNILKKEIAIKEQELDSCSFHPDRPARNYRVKNETDLDNLPVHDRLYERFNKKKERMNQFMHNVFEPTGSQGKTHKKQNRSLSASQERKSASTIKPFMKDMINQNVTTPAFDRLYKDMVNKKDRLTKLKEKVIKEEGVTFKPKTNWSKTHKKSLIDIPRSQQQQDLGISARYENRYIKEAYLQADHYNFGQESADNLSVGRYGQLSSHRQARNY